jgi:hypothetical protein
MDVKKQSVDFKGVRTTKIPSGLFGHASDSQPLPKQRSEGRQSQRR